MTLTTDSSVGVQSQGAGGVGARADLTISAGDEIDIRHDARTGTAPTIHADAALSATAANGITGAAGSPISPRGPFSPTAHPLGMLIARPHIPDYLLNHLPTTHVPHTPKPPR